MNQLAVISEAGSREAEFYRDFTELCPGARWQSLGRKGISGWLEGGTTVYGVFPVHQVIYPSGKMHETAVSCRRKAEGLSDLLMDTQLLRGDPA